MGMSFTGVDSEEHSKERGTEPAGLILCKRALYKFENSYGVSFQFSSSGIVFSPSFISLVAGPSYVS